MTSRNSSYTSRAALVSAVILVIVALRLAREVLIPFALAILLSFLLAPLVIRLQKWVGRIVAVVTVSGMTFLLIGALGWMVVGQTAELVGKLPEYEHNIRDKIRTIRTSMSGSLGRATRSMEEIAEEFAPTPPEVTPIVAVQSVPSVPLDESRQLSPFRAIKAWLGPVLAPLGIAAVIIVFVIFILLYYDDLRDRVLRLVGMSRLNETTQALDDAAHRVSRYLLMQTLLNAVHGTIVGVGLFFIGLPGPFFWGLSAALLRFIPYVGPLIAAILPMALALAIFDGWTQTLIVVGFLITLELISNNVLEPWLYGNSTGLSPMAVIVAAVFWGWLWGPAGLVLSAPLTVCLVVLGKHIGNLQFLNILLSDQPVLEPKARFYQRLLAMDQDAALEVVQKEMSEHSLEEVYDEVVVPALVMAEVDRHHGDLNEATEKFLLENMRDIIEAAGESDTQKSPPANGTAARRLVKELLCVPARDEADEIAGIMLCQLLEKQGIPARCLPVKLVGEIVELVEKEGIQVMCISAVPPLATTHARYLHRRLRDRFDKLPVIVGLWTSTRAGDRSKKDAHQDGNTQYAATLKHAVELIRQQMEAVILRPNPDSSTS